jgi:hypothetical protein
MIVPRLSILATVSTAAAIVVAIVLGADIDEIANSNSTLTPLSSNAPINNPSESDGIYEVENNFEYIGNDISSTLEKYSDFCYYYCRTTPHCAAWTWTDLNEGTCWLKTGRGRVVPRQGAKSGLMNATMPKDYFYGVGIFDNDMKYHIAKDTKESCRQECVDTYGCRAYTWSVINYGTCYLKSDIGRTVYSEAPGLVSGSFIPETNTTNRGIQIGFDIVGGDIGSVSNTPVDQCYDECLEMEGCRAYSWTSQNGGTCWLKNIALDMRPSEDVTSGVVFPNPSPPSGSVGHYYDIKGDVLEQKSSADAFGCISFCWANRKCKSFTWNESNGGTCNLKGTNDYGSIFFDEGVMSAIVRI